MEGGGVGKAVLSAEVLQGEAVTEHQRGALTLGDHAAKGLVEGLQLPKIGRQIGLVVLAVSGIGGAQRLADGAAQVLCHHGGSPHVFIVGQLFLFVVVMVLLTIFLMVMVMMDRGLHALHKFLSEEGSVLHHGGGDGDVLARRFQNLLHPQLTLAAVIEEHITLRQPHHIQRRWLEAVYLATCGNEEGGLYMLAADGAGKIVVGEAGGHNLQFALILCLRIL